MTTPPPVKIAPIKRYDAQTRWAKTKTSRTRMIAIESITVTTIAKTTMMTPKTTLGRQSPRSSP